MRGFEPTGSERFTCLDGKSAEKKRFRICFLSFKSLSNVDSMKQVFRANRYFRPFSVEKFSFVRKIYFKRFYGRFVTVNKDLNLQYEN